MFIVHGCLSMIFPISVTFSIESFLYVIINDISGIRNTR